MPQFNRSAIAAGTLIAGSALGGILAMQSQPDADSTPAPRITAELTANTWTASTQYEPAMAASGDGHVLVAWASRRQEDGAFGVSEALIYPPMAYMSTDEVVAICEVGLLNSLAVVISTVLAAGVDDAPATPANTSPRWKPT